MNTTKNPTQKKTKKNKKNLTKLAIFLQIILFNFYFLSAKTQAQTIVPATDGTGTTVTPVPVIGIPPQTRFDIQGGQLSGDRQNLFHSFQQFGLSQNQIANFILNPNIRNILARIGGGSPSLINGLIQVTGGNSNLLLMNPSGIIFGNNASLNVPAAFTATTATSIGFGSNSFNATGTNNYTSLTGTPNSFTFATAQPGAIINTANLAVKSGQNLTLLGGTVVSTGTVSAPNGQITIASVPGQNLLRLIQEGNLLSLEIQPPSGTGPATSILPIASLPQLLTGIGPANATGVRVNASGQVVLTASNQVVAGGDVAVQGINTGAIAVQAANNLTTGNLTSSQASAIGLEAKGDIQTGNLNSNSSNSSGGKITITSRTGKVETGNINSASTDKNGNGANITIAAESSIQTGNIEAHSQDKQGGSVTLSARNDIQVTSINTEGPTAGGNIDLTAGRYFRATGTFNSQPNCARGCSLSASTSTSANAGDITIRHGGGASSTLFTVGPDYNRVNGTAGIIATGGPSKGNVIANGSYSNPGPQIVQPTRINITNSVISPTPTPTPAPAPAPAPTPAPTPAPAPAPITVEPNAPIIQTPTPITVEPNAPIIQTPTPITVEPNAPIIQTPTPITVEPIAPIIQTPTPVTVGPIAPTIQTLALTQATVSPPAVSVNEIPVVSINLDVIPKPTLPPTLPVNPLPIIANPVFSPNSQQLYQISNSLQQQNLPSPTNINISNWQRNLDAVIFPIEERLTRDFVNYLNLPSTNAIATLEDSQKKLSSIEKATGIKPALIYITFLPKGNTVVDRPDSSSSILRVEQQIQNSEELELILVTASGEPIRRRIPLTSRTEVLALVQKYRNLRI